MPLVISIVLAIIPLLGIVWILSSGSIWTVDGLFMTLILAAMSGILGMNAVFELRKRSPAFAGNARTSPSPVVRMVGGGAVQRGKVEKVLFFESNVGQPNKSIVTLSNGAGAPRMLVFEGDLRNSLPAGKKVEITYRDDSGHKVLLGVNYL